MIIALAKIEGAGPVRESTTRQQRGSLQSKPGPGERPGRLAWAPPGSSLRERSFQKNAYYKASHAMMGRAERIGLVSFALAAPAFAAEAAAESAGHGEAGGGGPFAGDIGNALWTLVIFERSVRIHPRPVSRWGPILGSPSPAGFRSARSRGRAPSLRQPTGRGAAARSTRSGWRASRARERRRSSTRRAGCRGRQAPDRGRARRVRKDDRSRQARDPDRHRYGDQGAHLSAPSRDRHGVARAGRGDGQDQSA